MPETPKKVELLTPLKNKKSLKAVLNIADAVYFGVEAFNMRMLSNNFSLSELKETVERCHSHGIKAYLTTNIIIYENELEQLEELFKRAAEAQVDAIIIHDIGAIELAKKYNLPIHISTQASISNSRTARFYEKLGAERVILARELSLARIKEIARKLKTAEVETFVHGAQCTSISGRCYFSMEVCGSQDYSANRGRCVQPCRRKWTVKDEQSNEFLYDGRYFLNTKDLCMIEYIPQLIDAGIASFKIEGRMRDSLYIEETTKCYREAIDAYYEGNYTPQKVTSWLERLGKVYNRGFSTGFYFEMPKGSEIEGDRKGNISGYRKRQIGKVLSYFPKSKAAKILLSKGKIKLGQELIIIGTHTDTFVRQIVNSIQIKQKKNLTETPRVTRKEDRIAVGILVDEPVKKNDKVYTVVKRSS